MMVRFRVAPGAVRDEHIVEAYVPSEGNDAALFLVFNSLGAATKAAELFNGITTVAPRERSPDGEPKYGDD